MQPAALRVRAQAHAGSLVLRVSCVDAVEPACPLPRRQACAAPSHPHLPGADQADVGRDKRGGLAPRQRAAGQALSQVNARSSVKPMASSRVRCTTCIEVAACRHACIQRGIHAAETCSDATLGGSRQQAVSLGLWLHTQLMCHILPLGTHLVSTQRAGFHASSL